MQKERKKSELLRVKQLIKICKSSNISRIKYDNIEIEFDSVVRGTNRNNSIKIEKEDSKYVENPTADMPPDDVMLFAATPHYEEMLHSRKMAKKKG